MAKNDSQRRNASTSKPSSAAQPWKPQTITERILGRPSGSSVPTAPSSRVCVNGMVSVGDELLESMEGGFACAM